MKICPECKAEYRDEIDYCPDCDVELEEVRIDPEDEVEEMDPAGKPAYVSLSTMISFLGVIAIVCCVALTILSIVNSQSTPFASILMCCIEVAGIYAGMLFLLALCEFFQDVHLIRLQGQKKK